jgi:TrpR-related protein YerC/YecD
MENFHMEMFDELFEAVLKLKSVKDCRKFFEDVCTIKEIQDMTQRLEVAALLKQGNNYQEVSKKTGASTATISRVNKCLNYGSGGYNLVLNDNKDGESK